MAMAVALAMFAIIATPRPGIAGIRTLPVTGTTLLPGDIITPDRLTTRQFRTTERSLRGVATGQGELVGKQVRRRLIAGRPIPLASVGDVIAVRRSTQVPAHFEGGGLTISTRLVALEDGAVGQMIAARNPETGITVQALVEANGSLRIDSR